MTTKNSGFLQAKEISCLAGTSLAGRHITVSVPGSKSITNRALLLATLAKGTSVLRGALFSDDSRHFLKCIQDLGFATIVDENKAEVTVTGLGGAVPAPEASIYVGSAGTAARFLTAYLGITPGTWHLDASEQMRRRPMEPLISALKTLGCEVTCHEQTDCFPFTLNANGFSTDKVSVDIANSSQFLSALLIASCLSEKDMNIEVLGTHGMAYINMTTKMMEQFGVHTLMEKEEENTVYKTPAGQCYKALDYQIEPDLSAACYFYAMAAILGMSVTVKHVNQGSMQGDIQFLQLLTQMGCTLSENAEGLCITGPVGRKLKGITADMSSFSDQAITLAAIAPFADSPTTITGIGHIRFQESDRLAAIVTELGKMGIKCDATKDSVTIYPGTPTACAVDTYEDHRMAMGFSLIGLRVPGMVINNPGCCRKTFENYFEVLDEFIKECQTPAMASKVPSISSRP